MQIKKNFTYARNKEFYFKFASEDILTSPRNSNGNAWEIRESSRDFFQGLNRHLVEFHAPLKNSR